MRYLKTLLFVYVILCTFFVSIFLLLSAYGIFLARTLRADLPNGAYVNRAHLLSNQIVLRAPGGEIVVRDVAHVLFNDEYVAGEFYVTPYSTDRFVYKVGDEHAFPDLAEDDDAFEAMLADSGLDADWPWGPEDPKWLNFNRLLVRLGYRSPWPEY